MDPVGVILCMASIITFIMAFEYGGQTKPWSSSVVIGLMVAFAEAHQWLRQHFDEAAEINTRWVTGVDLDIMKPAIRRSNYDLRLSKNTLEGYAKKAIPMLVADKRMAKTVDPATVVDAQFDKYAERTAPQYFSDLPPIPADRRL